jgi:nicotinate phosphoribosyltransferase
MKLSKGKITLPGKKQIFRQCDEEGNYRKDIIGLEHEKVKGERLLVNVMHKGQVIYGTPLLDEIKKTTLKNLSMLPNEYKKLKNAPHYPVRLTPCLKRIKNQLEKELKNQRYSN